MPDVSLNGIEFKIKGSAADASSSVNKLQKALGKLQNIAFDLIAQGIDFTSDTLNNLNAAIDKLDISKLKSAAKALEKITGAGSGVSVNLARFADAAKAMESMVQSAQKFQDVFPTKYSLLDPQKQWAADMTSQIEFEDKNIFQSWLGRIDTSGLERLGVAFSSLWNRMHPVQQEAEQASKSLQKVGSASKSAASGIKDVTKSAHKANNPLSNFVASLKRIAFYRILRSILKSITQAFQEGLKNAYQFSKATGDGAGLAAALDNLATKSLTMKNQLGAAFGGLLTAITPIVIQIINLVIKLAEAITRLMAILGGGGSYLKAKDFWTDWGEAAEGAGGAAKKALEYLAPFDELNVLPDPKSGGGGGSSDGWGDMFEYVDVEDGLGFGDILIGIFDKISEFFQTHDWTQIGDDLWDKIKEAFSDTGKATEAVEALAEALGSAVGAGTGLFIGFVNGLVESLIKDIGDAIRDYNGDGQIDAVDVIGAVIKVGGDFFTWNYDHIVKPFLDGFGRALSNDDTFDFSVWTNENILNPMISAINSFIDKLNELPGINIPHIPLIGDVKDIEDKVPTEKKTVGRLRGALTDILDKIKSDDKVVDATAKFTSAQPGFTGSGVTGTGANAKPVFSAVASFVSYSKNFGSGYQQTGAGSPIFNSQANFTSYTKDFGSKYQTTQYGSPMFNSQANFTSRVEGGKFSTLFSSIAQFNSRALGSKFNTFFNSTAYFNAKSIAPQMQGTSTHNVLLDAIIKITGQKNTPIIDAILSIVTGVTGSANNSTNSASAVSASTSRAAAGVSIQVAGANYTASDPVGEDAMYRAFKRALDETDFGGDIELDGEKLYRNMVNRNREMKRAYGVNLMAT